MTSHLVPPHGGRLVDLMASPARVAELNAHAKEMASWSLAPRQLADLELLLSGAFSPLRGFMGSAEAESVRRDLRLVDGTFWPAPGHARGRGGGGEGARAGTSPWPCATGKGSCERCSRSTRCGETKDPATPAGTVSVAGLTEGVEAPHHYDFVELRATPAGMRERFAKWGWRKVAAFHTGEVMHRAEHELTLAAARELEASLLVQLGVATDSWWDAGHYSRIRCLQAVMKAYPPGTAHLNLLPLAPREAGARDLLLNAVVAQNYGCSHFLVRGSAAGAGDEVARPRRGRPPGQARARSGEGLRPRPRRLRGRGRGPERRRRRRFPPPSSPSGWPGGARSPRGSPSPRSCRSCGGAAPRARGRASPSSSPGCRARASPPSPTC